MEGLLRGVYCLGTKHTVVLKFAPEFNLVFALGELQCQTKQRSSILKLSS